MVCEMKLTNIPTYDIFVAEVLLLEQEVVVIKGSADCRIALSGGVDEVSSLKFLFSDFFPLCSSARTKLFLFIF
jgi:hypothetical protein